MKKSLNIKIHGMVQGVFFRYSAKEHADTLGITGFARNEEDDSVYIEAEGEEEKLDKFLKWCKSGPSLAKVTKIVVTEDPIKNFTEFIIQ